MLLKTTATRSLDKASVRPTRLGDYAECPLRAGLIFVRDESHDVLVSHLDNNVMANNVWNGQGPA